MGAPDRGPFIVDQAFLDEHQRLARDLQSRLGEGTCFTLALPAETPLPSPR